MQKIPITQKTRYKTIVALGDVHKEDKFLPVLIDFLIDTKPNYIIIAGDLFDFSEISQYDYHKRNYIGTKELARCVENEIKWGIDVLDRIDIACPKSQRVFIKGNHDARYDKYATYEAAQFNPDDRLLENRIALKDRGWITIQEGGHYRVGKLYFMHGERMGCENFAKTAAAKLRKNVRLWHNHTNQGYSISSPLDSTDTIEVKGVGCLCSKDPVYLRGLTNRWMNSFLVAYVLPNGNFQDFVVNIIGNKFISPSGKIYQN